MKLENKTKQEIIDELTQSRRRIAELESAESERKQVEGALLESEEHLRSLMESASGFVVYRLAVNPESEMGADIVFVSPSIEDIMCTTEPHKLETWLNCIHEDDAERIAEANRISHETGQRFNGEMRIYNPEKDEWHWVHGISNPVISKEGEITHFNGLIVDIADRKLAEEALKESEERLNKAQEIAHLGSWQWNLADNTFVLSDEMCRIYGITDRSQFTTLRSHLDEIIHQDDEERITQAAKGITESGAGETLVYRVVLPNGGVRWIEAAPPEVKQFDKNGHPQVVVGTVQDITERKQAEEALRKAYEEMESKVQERTVDLKNANKELRREIAKRKKVEKGLNESREQLRELSRYLQSLSERERTAASREIHDGMGQALTALKMDISWLNSKLTSKQKPLVDKAESMSRLIDNTIHEVQRFASQLRPKMLDDLGIAAAIEWQTQDFQSRTGIMCELSLKPGKNFTLNSDLSTMIFRISQETLTNITRHAEATRVSISLRDKAGKLIMEITDNGKGITHEQISSSASLGLIGMRERVTAFGGELKIKGMRGGGTKLTVTIPHQKDGKA